MSVSPTTSTATTTPASEPASEPTSELMSLATTPTATLAAASPVTVAPVVVTTPSPAGASRSPAALLSRARTEGVTGPAVVLLAAALGLLGVAADLPGRPTWGAGTTVAFLLVSVAGPAIVRFRSLLTAVALPPLMFAGAVVALGYGSGQNAGLRELVLDVATTLALAAPLLFAGTALAVAVAIARMVRHITCRR